MINTFSEVPGYQIYLQKEVTFLYRNNKHAEKETMELLPFTSASRTLKCVTKEEKDFYNEKLNL